MLEKTESEECGVAAETADLERCVEHQIVQRTWGRVRDLHVVIVAGRIVVTGWAASYYVKQLALLAIHEVVGVDRAVALDIQVGPAVSPLLQA